jgi:hypothetical protein
MNNNTIDILRNYNYNTGIIDIRNRNIEGLLDLQYFYNLKMLLCSNNQITEIIFPDSKITELDCSNNKIKELDSKRLDTLVIMKYENNPLEKIFYPSKMISNLFPKKYPENLTHLIFGSLSKFNFPVDNLPPNLTHLKFGNNFNFPVDNLPHNLIHLSFGCNFNHPVDNLPPNLTHLEFGYEFNQSVDNLPRNLTHLTLGQKFNQSVDNLPTNIKELGFSDISFIKNYIPAHISNIKVIFESFTKNQLIDNLPSHIKQIKINDISKIHYLKKIPFGCKIIDVNDNEILYKN